MEHSTSARMNPYEAVVQNPWTAKPAQLPDTYSGMSVPIKVRQSTSIVTVAAGTVGSGSFLFSPNGFNTGQVYTHASVAASNVVTWAAPTTLEDAAALSASFKACRLISAGICITYVGSETAAAGEIIAAPVEGLALGDLSTTISDWADIQGAVRRSVAYIKEPICIALSNFDRPPFLGLTSSQTSFFPQILVGFMGCGASNTFRIDVTLNYEFLALPTSALHHMQTNAPVTPNAIERVSRRLPSARLSTQGMDALIIAKGTATRKPYVASADGSRRRRYSAPANKVHYARQASAVKKTKTFVPYAFNNRNTMFSGSKRNRF